VRRRGKLLSAGLVLLVCPAFMASSAQGATLTIGSQFQGTLIASLLSPEGGTSVLSALPAPLIASSPTDGTVIDWRFIGGDGELADAKFTPVVVRQAGGGLYTVAGAGPPQSATGALAGPFPLNLAIKQGDLLGSRWPGMAEGNYFFNSSATTLGFGPGLVEGAPPQAPNSTADLEWAVSATVRYCLVPKLKGKKPKAARAALAASDCAVGKTKKSKKRRKRKKVLSQSVAPGTSISDTQPVDVKVSRKRKR
jgi:PASTA domain